jgi:hypothetical protein
MTIPALTPPMGVRVRILAALIALAACDARGERVPARSRQVFGSESQCDSARAAAVALDSVRRLDPFPSKIARMAVDSLGFRAVTEPANSNVLDGYAIVRIDFGCRIISLAQTDSA